MTKREQVLAAAQKFVADHEDDKGLLSVEDQATVDAMLTAAEALPRERSFRTQADVDKNPLTFGNQRGDKLVDERGRVCRALSHRESFAEAVAENSQAFGVRSDHVKWVNDGLSIGGALKAMVAGPTGVEKLALSEGDSSGAGWAVPSYLSAQIIDRFRDRAVVSRAGAQVVPLQGDAESFSFVKIVSDPTPVWRRESTDISESAPTFGRLNLHPKILSVIIRVSQELLEDGPNVVSAIERSLIGAFAAELDRAALFGNGAVEPQGLFSYVGLNEITGVGAIADPYDFVDGIKKLKDSNVPDVTAIVTSNREWSTLAKLKDTTNQPLQLPAALADIPWLETSAMPATLGGGGNESCAFLGYWPDLYLGMRSELRITRLNELYAAKGEVGFACRLRTDNGLIRPASLCRLLGITP